MGGRKTGDVYVVRRQAAGDFYSAEKARGYKSRWNAESPAAAVSSSERDVLRPSRAHQEVLGGHLLPHRYQGLRKVSPPPRTARSRPPAPVPSCCAAPATAPTTCNVERVSGERGAGRRGPPRGSAAWTPPAPIAKSHVPTGPPTPHLPLHACDSTTCVGPTRARTPCANTIKYSALIVISQNTLDKKGTADDANAINQYGVQCVGILWGTDFNHVASDFSINVD